MGEQGQVGFNEAGSYAKSVTRLVQLSHQSRKAQANSFYGIENTPRLAITMGLNTVMSAQRIILVAWGENKASTLRKVVEEDATRLIPASLLQNHNQIEAVVDDPAAEALTVKKAPWLVGPCNWTPRMVRKAVVWLCETVKKPILKLTYRIISRIRWVSCSTRLVCLMTRLISRYLTTSSIPLQVGPEVNPMPTIRLVPREHCLSPNEL